MAPPIVKRYLLALDRHKWVGLAGLIAVTGLSGLVAALQQPPAKTYVAQGLLTYSKPPEIFSVTGASLQQQGQAVTVEMLMSPPVVAYTIQQLKAQQIDLTPRRLTDNTKVAIEGQAAPTSGASANQALKVTVTYGDTNDKRTSAVAAALMDSMVEQSLHFNKQQFDRINTNLNQVLPKITQELRQSERNLEQYVRQEGTALQTAESGALLNTITSNQAQQRQLRLSLAGVEAQLRSLQARLGLTPDQAYASSALSADPIVADLRAKIYGAESQRALLAQTLRPDHPSMIELQNQLNIYSQQLQIRVNEVLGGQSVALGGNQIRQSINLDPARQQLASLLVGLQTQRDTQQQQLIALAQAEQQLRQDYAGIPNKQLEQQHLQQQVALKQAFYDKIQARLADVKLAQEETVGSLVIAQPPQLQLLPVKSASKIVVLLIGGFMGLVIGGGLVLLLDSLDPIIYTLEDVQAALRSQDVPIHGLLPALPIEMEVDGLPLLLAAHSPYLDPYERLRGNLRRLGGAKPLRMILVASTLPEEGKTVVAYNLAIASARAGKRTLLIEADLRSPSHAPALKLAIDPNSAIEPLRYYGNLAECIRLVPAIENLYIVPSVGVQRQAAAILESSEMRRLLEDARGRFDLVILDSPPLSRYNDTMLLEPSTDGLLLVTRPGYTEAGLLDEAVQQFMEAEDIQFLGAVINDAEIAIDTSGDTSANTLDDTAIEVSKTPVLTEPDLEEKVQIGIHT